MAEKKTIFTKENQVQKNFRIEKSIAAKLEELAKEDRRTELATVEILIEKEYLKRNPKKK